MFNKHIVDLKNKMGHRNGLFVLSAIFGIICESNGQFQFLREVKPTTNVPTRSHKRQVVIDGYQGQVVQQHADATAALTEARDNADAEQFLLDAVGGVQLQEQQQSTDVQVPVYAQPNAYPQLSSGIIYFDQFGQLVQGSADQQQGAQVQQTAGQPLSVETEQGKKAQEGQAQTIATAGLIRLIDQHGNTVGHTHAHPQYQIAQTPVHYTHSHAVAVPQPQVVQHGVAVPQPQLIQHGVAVPQPHVIQHNVPAPVLHHAAPVFHQILTPEGIVFQQVLQHQHGPVLHEHAPHIHEHFAPAPILQHGAVLQPQPVVHFQQPQAVFPPAAIPLVEKVPVVKKIKTLVPDVKIIRQPILPPAVFQKEIFAVKNPRQRVLTYSDLCTVYPYQRKISACVYKKAAIPEFHHPDLQLVPEETINQAKHQSSTNRPESLLNPRTNPLKIEENSGLSNIQDILKSPVASDEQHNSQEQSEERVDDSSVNFGASSNKNEKLIKKISKNNSRRNGEVSSSKKVTTTTTSAPKITSTSTTKKPKSKRRSRNSRRNKERRNRKKNASSTTSERPFKLV